MRIWKVLCAPFTILFIPTVAAAADIPPRQRAGEWQIVQLSENRKGLDYVSTECVGDRSILSKFETIPHCSHKESHTNGDITIADALCRVQDSAMSFHEKIMKLDSDNFYIYQHVTMSPPVLRGTELEQAELISFTHWKRLGACPAGERPLK